MWVNQLFFVLVFISHIIRPNVIGFAVGKYQSCRNIISMSVTKINAFNPFTSRTKNSHIKWLAILLYIFNILYYCDFFVRPFYFSSLLIIRNFFQWHYFYVGPFLIVLFFSSLFLCRFEADLTAFYTFVDTQPLLTAEEEFAYGKAIQMSSRMENIKSKSVTDGSINAYITDEELATYLGVSLETLGKIAPYGEFAKNRMINSNLKLVLGKFGIHAWESILERFHLYLQHLYCSLLNLELLNKYVWNRCIEWVYVHVFVFVLVWLCYFCMKRRRIALFVFCFWILNYLIYLFDSY